MDRDARQLPVQHLSVRLAWHDTGWTGRYGPRESVVPWRAFGRG